MNCIAGYASGTKFDRLGAAELFVLMPQRLWVGLYRKVEEQSAYWWEGFADVGVSRQSAAAFDIFMQILFYASCRRLDIRAHLDQCLGGDEILLLRFISDLQHHQYSRALDVLEGLMEGGEAALAWKPSVQMAAGLAAAQLIVPLWQADFVTARRVVICDAVMWVQLRTVEAARGPGFIERNG